MPRLSHDEFMALLTKSQRRLYGFIGTLVVDRTDADDVLQETNLALWQMADHFEPGTDFTAWAFQVARYRVLKQQRSARRHRVRFADQVVDLLTAETLAETHLDRLAAAEQFETLRRALAACLEEVSERNRGLLLQYYDHGRSLADIGATIGRNANAVAQLFHRIRAALRACIRQRLPSTQN